MISFTMPRTIGARAVVGLACVALSLTALGDAEESQAAGTPTAPDDAARSSEQVGGDRGAVTLTSPLTGLPVTGDGKGKPVSVVKIDNTSHARPQVGLDQADLIV